MIQDQLYVRRTRADIIEVFKIVKRLDGLNREDFFEMEVEQRTKGKFTRKVRTYRVPSVKE